MEKLKVKGLCKTYIIDKRQNNVLRNIEFEMEKGEMLAIMGPSGSGKTTLLYTVSGMDKVTSGEIDFFGKKITNLTEGQMSTVRLLDMGFVFQQMYMLKSLSIYDNIVLPAYQAYQSKEGRTPLGRKKIGERAQKLMKKLGINDVADNAVTEVSGGQLQRACICRSLMNNPKIIFADEPTGALNKQNSLEVMKELIRINREGTSIMLVTHDMKVASKCERVLYIEDGNIKEEIILGKWNSVSDDKERECVLSDWLMRLGW